jgi:hypothetical protein
MPTLNLWTHDRLNYDSFAPSIARGGAAFLFLLVSALPIAASERGDPLSLSEVIVLLAANSLCGPSIVDPRIVDAAVQRLDDAWPSDVRTFLLGQRRMMVEASIGQPPTYVDNICDGARLIAAEHDLLAEGP